MPEGPLLILYKEDLSTLAGHTLENAETKLRTADLSVLEGRTLTGISTWGKYLFMQFGPSSLSSGEGWEEAFLRIHWGMFGTYYLDRERPKKEPTAVLHFSAEHILRLYSVSLRVMEGAPSQSDYDPRADVMNADWDKARALQKLHALPPEAMICDALLDQAIFAGVGNAIKTEALFAQRIHPESRVAAIPEKLLQELVEETVGQSQLFLEGKRTFGAERYGWTLVYRRRECPRCGGKLTVAHTGLLQRKSHWCEVCAIRYH